MSEPVSPISYRDAGVDRDAANRAKNRVLQLVRSTTTAGVVPNPGGFGGLFRVPMDLHDPLLVSSADGVGTKLKVAMMANRHETVGHDLVNHCVNDILVEGARPLFFLDYIGMGKLEPGVVEQVVAGIVAGCKENGCALLGGETAEMPDFYDPGEYDLAGFIVGVVGADARLGAGRVQEGDVLLGLAANGFHTNGYSLVRKILFERAGLQVDDPFPGKSHSVADELLRVHRSYLHAVMPLLSEGQADLHALAHITGGGILENLDRVIPDGLQAVVDLSTWDVPQEFKTIAELSGLGDNELFRTFNMGIGMIVVVAAGQADRVSASLQDAGETVFTIGHIGRGEAPVRLV
jgi:phosphoribosylformylglycinamidine cyclo-ligase